MTSLFAEEHGGKTWCAASMLIKLHVHGTPRGYQTFNSAQVADLENATWEGTTPHSSGADDDLGFAESQIRKARLRIEFGFGGGRGL